MMQALCDTSPEVRQAAAYGIGVMAQFGGESYRPFCTGEFLSEVHKTLFKRCCVGKFNKRWQSKQSMCQILTYRKEFIYINGVNGGYTRALSESAEQHNTECLFV